MNSKYFFILQSLADLSSSQISVIKKVLNNINKSISDPNKFLFLTYYSTNKRILEKLLEKAEIDDLLPLEKYSQDNNKFAFKAILVDDDTSRLGKSPSLQIKQLSKTQRGLNVNEGIWLTLFNKNILKKHSIDLIDSLYSRECIPTIYSWKSETRLSAICPDVSDFMCAAPIIEKEIELSVGDFKDNVVLEKKIGKLLNN
ncbi:MAG TPA: hypothetical protein VMR41_00995 [Patescibacteria group bacterium]|nr:hypothetical protein [Patescibacteria group bacterium]